jgi:hypothetical protein
MFGVWRELDVLVLRPGEELVRPTEKATVTSTNVYN